MAFSIQPLDRSHDLQSFNCGNTALDVWLQHTAKQHQTKNLSQTYVLIVDNCPEAVIGFYALSIRGLTPIESLPQKLKKTFPRNVPTITIARLAVANQEQKKGHGERLLLDAMLRAKSAAKMIGGSFLFVDAKDGELARFYARHGLTALPDDPLTLCMPVADVP